MDSCQPPTWLANSWHGSGNGCDPNSLTSHPSCYGREYYFDYTVGSTKARFILISPGIAKINTTSSPKWTYSTGDPHYNWVRDTIDAARNDASFRWIVVGMHKNCVSTATKSCETGFDLWNLLVSKNVDLIIQGHDHTYQRGKQLALNTSTCTGFVSDGNNRPTYNEACIIYSGDFYPRRIGSVLNIVGTGGQGLYTINGTSNAHEFGYFKSVMGSNTNPGNNHGFSKYDLSYGTLAGSTNMDPTTFSDTFSITRGGSVAYGTRITLSSGVQIPVQNVRVGDHVILVNVCTGAETTARVDEIVTTRVDSLLTIHTTYHEPLRIDANPSLWLHVQLATGETIWKQATAISQGDKLYNHYAGGWVTVTGISLAQGGQHVMYDLKTTPFGDYLANGYADCPCKQGPGG